MTRVSDPMARVASHHRLLLTAALGSTENARTAWARWSRDVVFDDIDGPTIRLLPILARRPDVVAADHALHGRVRGLYRKAWVSNERLIAAGRPVRQALVAAGVPLLHVEALPLARVVGDHALRPLHDLDLCVPVRQVGDVLRVLTADGWAVQRQPLRSRWQRRPLHVARDGVRLRVLQGVPWPGADASAWHAAVAGDEPGESSLDLADALVHAAVRSVQPWQAPVQWVADITWLAHAMGHVDVGAAADAERVIARARAHGVDGLVRDALAAAARVVGPFGQVSGVGDTRS